MIIIRGGATGGDRGVPPSCFGKDLPQLSPKIGENLTDFSPILEETRLKFSPVLGETRLKSSLISRENSNFL
jgi:hypothetical protein